MVSQTKTRLAEKLAFIFIIIWTSGQVLDVPHSDNVIFSTFVTLSFAFYYDFHKVIISKIFLKN